MTAGEHLFVDCGSYSHHGIDLGDGTVVHFDATPWQKLTGRTSASEHSATIQRVSYAQFAQGRPVFRRQYAWCLSSHEVSERARSRLGESGYHLFANNCEHFAVWCKTGQWQSTQVDSIVRSTTAALRGATVAMAVARVVGRTSGRARLAMVGVTATLTVGIGVTRFVCDRIRNRHLGVS